MVVIWSCATWSLVATTTSVVALKGDCGWAGELSGHSIIPINLTFGFLASVDIF